MVTNFIEYLSWDCIKDHRKLKVKAKCIYIYFKNYKNVYFENEIEKGGNDGEDSEGGKTKVSGEYRGSSAEHGAEMPSF